MTARAWRQLSGLLVIATMSRPLGAQRPLTIDAGIAVARFEDDDATAFGPSVRLMATGTRGRLFGTAEGGSIVTFGAAAGYATLAGGIRSAPAAHWMSELSAELSTVAGSNSSGGAGTALASGRAVWNRDSRGGWLRGTGHLAARTHSMLSGAGLDAGGWWSWPRGQLSASLLQEWTSAELYIGRFRTGFSGTTPVRYTEATLALHLEGDRASLDIAAGARRDPDAASAIAPAWSASAAVWQSETTAIVLGLSRQLPDWIRGSDGADIASLGMRFRQRTPVAERAARLLPVVQVVESSDGRVLRVRAPGARAVDVMGDFTDWEPITLTRSGVTFQRVVRISAGSHRLLVRVDGGAWRPAANTPAVDDDLGGRAGLLVVP